MGDSTKHPGARSSYGCHGNQDVSGASFSGSSTVILLVSCFSPLYFLQGHLFTIVNSHSMESTKGSGGEKPGSSVRASSLLWTLCEPRTSLKVTPTVVPMEGNNFHCPSGLFPSCSPGRGHKVKLFTHVQRERELGLLHPPPSHSSSCGIFFLLSSPRWEEALSKAAALGVNTTVSFSQLTDLPSEEHCFVWLGTQETQASPCCVQKPSFWPLCTVTGKKGQGFCLRFLSYKDTPGTGPFVSLKRTMSIYPLNAWSLWLAPNNYACFMGSSVWREWI